MLTERSSSDVVGRLQTFLNSATTPYHAVAEAVRQLRQFDYVDLDERDEWQLVPRGRYLVVRDGTLIATSVGDAAPHESGFVVLAAHCDSPCLRLKPVPDIDGAGCRQLGVEVYGSPLLYTWLDRELGIAGRVSLRDGTTHLVELMAPTCVIPSVAIHLNRDINTKGLRLNPQGQLNPIWSLRVSRISLREVLAARLSECCSRNLDTEDISAFDLSLYDPASADIVGPDRDLLCGPRLDNLIGCHAALEALTSQQQNTPHTRVIVLHNHEEIGSRSESGADSRLLLSVLERMALGATGATSQAPARALARSLLVAVDMAHGVHPNWTAKHDEQHPPRLGAGPVLKINASQAYATSAPGGAAVLSACQAQGIAPQYFVSRNDLRCGSTVGPISAARLAVRTAELGSPMLAMHACRETAAVADVEPLISVLSQVLAGTPSFGGGPAETQAATSGTRS
jgi:aspartyl aminopeptidase